jgi:hypothetical protein
MKKTGFARQSKYSIDAYFDREGGSWEIHQSGPRISMQPFLQNASHTMRDRQVSGSRIN